MYLQEAQVSSPVMCRRRTQRHSIQCRAKIQIGKRHYTGYIHNISRAGAKLRTISPIRKLGSVVLTLPDLPPIRCELRWTDSYNAGVQFARALRSADFAAWAEARSHTNADRKFITTAAELVWEASGA
jgi:hypothetical protein